MSGKILGVLLIIGGLFLSYFALTASNYDIYKFVIAPLGRRISFSLARGILFIFGIAVIVGGLGFITGKLKYLGLALLLAILAFLIAFL